MRDNGIVDESVFPNSSGGGQVPSCIPLTGEIKYKIDGFESISLEDPQIIKTALIDKGPVVFIRDYFPEINGYSGGIIATPSDPTSFNVQANAIVGFNDNESYWIIRNSWGSYQ